MLWKERKAIGHQISSILLITELISFCKAKVARVVHETNVCITVELHNVGRASCVHQQKGNAAWVQLAATAAVFLVAYQRDLTQ